MAYWNDLLLGFFWAIVFIVLVLRFSYQPLLVKANLNVQDQLNTQFEKNSIDAQRMCFYLILLVGLTVRIWDFGAIPAGFNQDGAMAAVDAKALADYGTDRFGMKWPVHFTAWGYGQMSVLLSYMMVPFIKIFGFGVISVRAPVLIISLFGMLAAYGFVKNTFDRVTALIVLFLIAINPWHIMQSRWALDCNLFPHFFIIGCYFLTLLHVKRYFLYLAMLSFALCMYSYGIAFFTVPLFLLGIAIYMWLKKIASVKEIMLSVVVYVAVSWPVWLVMIINFLRKPTIQTPFFTIPFFPDSVRSGEILFFSQQFSTQLKTNFNALLNTTVLQRPDLPWNAIDQFATLYLFTLPLLVLGVVATLIALWQPKKTLANHPEAHVEVIQRNFGYIILIGGGLIGVWAGLVIGSVNVNRINIIYYFLIVFSGVGLAQLYQWFRPAFVISSAVYMLAFMLFCGQYFGSWSRDISVYFFDGMGKALQQAAKIDTPKYYVTVNSQFEGAKATSEILTLFHHQVDAKYFQGELFSEESPSFSSLTVAGNKYNKPYSERYVYFDPKQSQINSQENAVYIVAENEIKYFDLQFFDLIRYQGFVLLVRKGLS